MNNFDRIHTEITNQANRVPEDFEAETLITLAMEIVDHEDRHATKRVNINQIVENLIEQAANAGAST